MKVLITHAFHRFVSEGEGKPEREQRFPKGKTIAEGDDGVTAADLADWIAKGLAADVSEPPAPAADEQTSPEKAAG